MKEKKNISVKEKFLLVLKTLVTYLIIWAIVLGITVLNDLVIGGKSQVSANIITEIWSTAIVSVVGVIILFICMYKQAKKEKTEV